MGARADGPVTFVHDFDECIRTSLTVLEAQYADGGSLYMSDMSMSPVIPVLVNCSAKVRAAVRQHVRERNKDGIVFKVCAS